MDYMSAQILISVGGLVVLLLSVLIKLAEGRAPAVHFERDFA